MKRVISIGSYTAFQPRIHGVAGNGIAGTGISPTSLSGIPEQSDIGFPLRTYSHLPEKYQEPAVSAMGNILTEALQNKRGFLENIPYREFRSEKL